MTWKFIIALALITSIPHNKQWNKKQDSTTQFALRPTNWTPGRGYNANYNETKIKTTYRVVVFAETSAISQFTSLCFPSSSLALPDFIRRGPGYNRCIMGLTTQDPYIQKEHTELYKIFKFRVNWANIEQDTAIQKL